MNNAPLDHPQPDATDLPDRWLAALLAWDSVRPQMPDVPDTYLSAVARLTEARREQDADRVMGEAVRRFADNAWLAVEHAKAAESRKDWDAALVRWYYARAAFPLDPVTHWGTASLLRQHLGRTEEAEAVLEAATAMFPNRLEFWNEHAQAATDRKDRATAIQRFHIVRERFPSFADGYLWSAALLRDEHRFDEAEAVLAEALVRFPDNEAFLVDRAWLAGARQDWDAARVRWEAVRTAHPANLNGYWRAGEVLMNVLGRLDEAEDLLAAGMVRFPDHIDIAIAHAQVAEKRGDVPELRQRLHALAERFPGNSSIQSHAERAAMLVQASAVDAAGVAVAGHE